jgi:hypothetical protein
MACTGRELFNIMIMLLWERVKGAPQLFKLSIFESRGSSTIMNATLLQVKPTDVLM